MLFLIVLKPHRRFVEEENELLQLIKSSTIDVDRENISMVESEQLVDYVCTHPESNVGRM